MTKKKQKSSRKLTAQDLQIAILKLLLANPKKQYAPRQIIDQLGIENNKDSVDHALQQLVQTGSVVELSLQKYSIFLQRLIHVSDEPEVPIEPKPLRPRPKRDATESLEKEADVQPFDLAHVPRTIEKPLRGTDKSRKVIQGRVDMTRTGAAYIVSELQDTDIYVPNKYVNGALHGDTVEVLLFPAPPRVNARRGQSVRKPEGEILRVIKRANEFFIGTIRLNRKYALFYPDNPNMPIDVYIPLEQIGAAKDNDKVVIKITDWQEGKGRVPMGAVTEVLGVVGGNDFEMKKILVNAGFELSHSEESMREANSIPETVPDQEIERRRDFRDVLTFTIDPEDAKDFDDALSIQELESGNLEIGIHIADVTHYLKPDSPMDK